MSEEKGQIVGLLSPLLERQRILHAIRFVPRNADVLDIGCGRSGVLQFIPEIRSYIGLDVLDAVVRENSKNFPQFQFLRENIEEGIPAFEKKFTVILMLAVLEHLASPGGSLKTLASCLSEH